MNLSNLNWRLRAGKLWLAGVAATAALLVACGGGGGGGTEVGSGGTGSSASGPITGFGSIIVNGVRYDDSSAQIILDDDSSNSSALKLGMIVMIEGDKNADGTTGTADRIVTSSFVQGQISDTPANDQFTVFGTTVTVNARTLYENVSGFSGLAMNDTVEVYGIPNASGGVTATRIEKKAPTKQARLIGTVQNVTASDFKINGITIQYGTDDLRNLPDGLQNGMLVRVKGEALNATTINADRVQETSFTPSVTEGEEFEITGIVTRFASADDFDVNGQQVSLAPGAEVSGTVALNKLVEVEGVMTNGVLVATEVELEDENEEQKYEVHSLIADLNTGAKTFTVRGGTLTVQWSNATVFEGVTEAELENNLSVEVKGEFVNSILIAEQIELED